MTDSKTTMSSTPEGVLLTLDITHDRHARVAALAYAQSIDGDDPRLADEILEAVLPATMASLGIHDA